MEDGSWKHFEFQSKNEGLDGLKRFRSYEALASYQHKVSVTTYVLFSGNIQNPMTQFTEGINTYRIVPIIMREFDADEMIQKLKEKVYAGEKIERYDLVPLALAPLMSGKSSQKQRILAAYEITHHARTGNSEDVETIAERIGLSLEDVKALKRDEKKNEK